MEVERYKMIFTTKINKELNDKIAQIYIGPKLKKEIYSYNIRILGQDFVKNNKNKAKLIINNKKYGLKELVNNEDLTKDKIKIIMILSKDISNVSHMFEDCVKLLEISIYDDIININDEKFYKFEEFLDCNIEPNKDDYENNYEDNYKNFYNDNDNIYSNCSEITKREKRDTNLYNSIITEIKNNITINNQYNYYSNMSYMFCGCLSLSLIPDIFKRNTDKVNDMGDMFSFCSSLLSLPDISKWNTNNVMNMSGMLYNCSSLLSLPVISKWNTKNVNDIIYMFSESYV